MIDRYWRTNLSFDGGQGGLTRRVEDMLLERDGSGNGVLRNLYYLFKPLIPRVAQIYSRRLLARSIEDNGYSSVDLLYRDALSGRMSDSDAAGYFIWFWPKGNEGASILTHDVETQDGMQNVLRLAGVDEEFGFRSAFGFVPERYRVDLGVLEELRDRGFEIAVHGLKHDGKLFSSERVFRERLARIELYAQQWKAKGFRSSSLLRNSSWMQAFRFDWDSSFPDWDPYGPQPGGCRTVFPFFLSQRTVELPVTLMQDHTLLELIGADDISVWKDKVNYIRSLNGLVNIVVHPDYIFRNNNLNAYRKYLEFLRSTDGVWHALPSEVADWWKRRDSSRIALRKGCSIIEGPADKDGSICSAECHGSGLVINGPGRRS